LILVGRNKKELEKTGSMLKTSFDIIEMDLSNEDNCKKLYEMLKGEDIDVLINNAGFGMFGEFINTDLDRELSLIDTNIKAVHILTKLFLKEMVSKNKGYILNVSSAASFSPGPLMATYYASKSYVQRLSLAINKELKKKNSNVFVSTLCPGPVDTNFNDVANVRFSVKPLSSNYVARYALKKLFKKKKIIIPGFLIKMTYILSKIAPLNIMLAINYKIQHSKKK